ncbi:MAG TPA: cytochrome c oxidase assembly protein [Acidobacteriaceae bacterium]|nr:cytochrome c oxidase assembly protein [Acidobacteriaceae bacterium]
MDRSALWTTWDIPWGVTSVLIVSALIYTRGWARIRRTRPDIFPRWRLISFLGGMSAIFIAVASPLDAFADRLLVMHMVQHFFLMFVAPPLIIFAAPVVPMLRGLPRGLMRRGLRPLFASGIPHKIGAFLTRPRVALLAWILAFLGWHIPHMYELALSSETIHEYGEHASFFLTSLMLWWPVIAPWPFRHGKVSAAASTLGGEAHRWVLIPYLMLADVANTAVSAFLCFSGRVLYPSYALQPRLFGLSALTDQIAAGAFMWVMGSMAFLIPGMILTVQLLSPRRRQRLYTVPVAR